MRRDYHWSAGKFLNFMILSIFRLIISAEYSKINKL